jgi:hypothetical protein
MAVPETVLILATGTVVLAILFGARLIMRDAAGGSTIAPRSDGDETTATGASGTPDVAGVIALPPFIFLGFAVAATLLEVVVPLRVLAAHALARYLAGGVLAACGFVLIGMGTRRFVAAGTNIPPNLPTTALVVDGIYGRTRNPLYLGTTLVYLGLAVAAGSGWAIASAVWSQIALSQVCTSFIAVLDRCAG